MNCHKLKYNPHRNLNKLFCKHFNRLNNSFVNRTNQTLTASSCQDISCQKIKLTMFLCRFTAVKDTQIPFLYL